MSNSLNNNKIKWACIQPLTGGMYLGAEEAIGHPAEFILSFEGLDSVSLKKDGSVGRVGNENYLKRYLEKHGKMPAYYQIQGGLFDMLGREDFKIVKDGEESVPDYTNLDLVAAVPICAGLSTASTGSKEDRERKNTNMKFITSYVLGVIRPKIYVFENAPGLMGDNGAEVRKYLEEAAKENGYSVLYYKTDTNLHYNCQRRLRTFIIFFKHRGDKSVEDPMLFEYQHCKADIIEYFNNIDRTLNPEQPETPSFNWIVLDFIRQEYG